MEKTSGHLSRAPSFEKKLNKIGLVILLTLFILVYFART